MKIYITFIHYSINILFEILLEILSFTRLSFSLLGDEKGGLKNLLGVN